MELKSPRERAKIQGCPLLIEPYGIEICIELYHNSDSELLIEPYGIEIKFDGRTFGI